MAGKPTYEELEQKVKELEKEGFERKRTKKELKRADEALRKSEERFRLLAETSPDYIYQVDTEGKILYTSSAVEQVLGYKPQELIGKFF